MNEAGVTSGSGTSMHHRTFIHMEAENACGECCRSARRTGGEPGYVNGHSDLKCAQNLCDACDNTWLPFSARHKICRSLPQTCPQRACGITVRLAGATSIPRTATEFQ